MAVTVTEGHQPLLITAHLRTGLSIDLPYGLDLAGILASRLRTADRATINNTNPNARKVLPDTTGEDPDDMNLPLSTCTTDDTWHWLASCAIVVDANDHPEPRTYYRTVDSGWAQRAAERPLPYHHPSKGPYRDMMMPAPVITCPAVQWHAVGDHHKIDQLVRGLRHIGRRRATGEGGVLTWTVEPTNTDPARWTHVDADNNIIRPCPEQCAINLDVPYRLGWYAIRPPSWHPDRLTTLAMTPEPEDEW